jgi:hypothetical protein
MAYLHETSHPGRIAEIDPLGWLLAALIAVVTAGAWMVAYKTNKMILDHCAAPRRTASPAVNWGEVGGLRGGSSSKQKHAWGPAYGERLGLGASPRFCAP